MMKRAVRLLITLLCLFALAGSAFASNTNTLIWVEDGVWYEKNTQMFVYCANDSGAELVRASVADGMITTKMVSVTASVPAKLKVYRNGELLGSDIYRQLGDAGDYVVMYENAGAEKRIMSFSVIPAVTNTPVSYLIPKGFEIVQATLDNLPIDHTENQIYFQEEGDYRVVYRCIRTGMNYSLNFTTDYTGPTLELNAVTDGRAQGPVSISDAKDAYSVEIFKDGEQIDFQETLTASGTYRIRLFDATGNVTTYEFTILIYFTALQWLAIAGAVLLAAGTIVYLILSRKKLTVR